MILEVGGKDFDIVTRIMELHPRASIFELQKKLVYYFKKDIKPGHFILLGYLIGINARTDEPRENLLSYNSLLCQKQN